MNLYAYECIQVRIKECTLDISAYEALYANINVSMYESKYKLD
jgi:hypothetical protein